MYKKFASRILCMDSTHKTNSYSFKLVTLMVADEFRKGYPVAFCISNREDETVMNLFLSSVKALSPETKVNVIMTDDDNAGWNAAQSVYGVSCIYYILFIFFGNCRQEGHTNPPSAEVATAETSHGSVAPYPPLRLVPPQQQPIQLPTNEEQNLFA
ncbi:uncharacterized protein LOC130046477 [Ostrea edulis]|uniref:uncharacterized protein LOC130046477 n=1 Tax=Ostrea edulis TaxID=37623 RepID=UPI0024AFD366|nr:uncharacterized protein LOC130046477 [Ostrea edulis]